MGNSTSCGYRDRNLEHTLDEQLKNVTEATLSVGGSKPIPLLLHKLQQLRETPGGHLKDRADLHTKWNANLCDFLSVNEQDTSQSLFLALDPEGLTQLADVHEMTKRKLKGDYVAELLVPTLASLTLRQPGDEKIMVRMQSTDAPEIGAVVKHLTSEEQLVELMLSCVKDNIREFTIEVYLEQLKLSFEKQDLLDDYITRTKGDNPAEWPKCWPILDMSFATCAYCKVSPQVDNIQFHLEYFLTKHVPASSVAATMHSEGFDPIDIQRFLLMTDPAEKMGSQMFEILKQLAPNVKFCFVVHDDKSTAAPKKRKKQAAITELSNQVTADAMNAMNAIEAVQLGGTDGQRKEKDGEDEDDELDGCSVNVTVAEGISKLLKRLRHGVDDISSWRALLSWEPLEVKTVEGCLHRGKRFKAMGDDDEYCEIMSQAVGMVLQETRNSGVLKAVAERYGGPQSPRLQGYVIEKIHIDKKEDLLKVTECVTATNVFFKQPFPNNNEVVIGDLLVFTHNCQNIGDVAKLGVPVSLSIRRRGTLTTADINYIIYAMRDSFTALFKSLQDGLPKANFERLLQKLCSKMIHLCDEVFLPPAMLRNDYEAISLFLKTKADYMRYMFLWVPAKRAKYSGTMIRDTYSQALEAGKKSGDPCSLTVMTTAINAAVAVAEIDRDHQGAAKICREALEKAMGEIGAREWKRKQALKNKDSDPASQSAKEMGLSSKYNLNLLQSNALALESSVLLLSVSFVQDEFLAELNKLEPIKDKVSSADGDVEMEGDSRRSRLPTVDDLPGLRGPLCRASCDASCDEVECDKRRREDPFTEEELSTLAQGVSFNAPPPPVLHEEVVTEFDEGRMKASVAEIEMVRRWLAWAEVVVEPPPQPVKKKQSDEEDKYIRKTPLGYPTRFNWLDHAEMFSSALAAKYSIMHPRAADEEEPPAISPPQDEHRNKWAAIRNSALFIHAMATGGHDHKEKTLKAFSAQRTWLVACVCGHLPGEVPEVEDNGWAKAAVHSLLVEDKKSQAEKQQDLENKVTKSSGKHAVGAGCRRHTFETTAALERLMAVMKISDGSIREQYEVTDGILLAGDKLLLTGPLTGSQFQDIPRLTVPTKLTFQLKEFHLQAHSIVPVISGPYVEIHEQFWNFRGTFLHPTEKFKNLAKLLSSLEDVHNCGLWRSVSNKPADEYIPKEIPCLSARRHPQLAMGRGVK